MRILFVSHAWTPESRGGTELHARDTALGLIRRGHELGVFCRTSADDLDEYQVRTGVDEGIGITRINNRFQDFNDLEWLYKNERVHEAFARELDEFRPDLVHIHHLSGLSSTIIEELKLRAVPTVMTLHDFWTVCPRGQRMRTTLEICEDVDRQACFKCLRGLWPHIFDQREATRTIVDQRGQLSPVNLAEFDRHMAYVLNLCDRLITPSEFHRERMLDFPIEPERIVALPHGLRTEIIPATEREARPVRRIGFIGSVIPVKGVHILLSAFQQLSWPGLELHIHGEMPPFHEDKSYGDRLQRMAGDRQDIQFHGAYDTKELPRILGDLDLLVVPSLWWESFCLTIREGLLAGVPVIASDIGAMREALDGERDGILFKTGDPLDLARKIERFLMDAPRQEELSQRRSAVKTQDTYLRELEHLYLETISVAAERAPSLVIAPPSFPQMPPPPAPALETEVDWDAVKVSLKESSLKGLEFKSRLPEAERPRIELELAVRDGDRSLGAVDVEIDLSEFASLVPAQQKEAAPDAKPEPKAPAAAKSPRPKKRAKAVDPAPQAAGKAIDGEEPSVPKPPSSRASAKPKAVESAEDAKPSKSPASQSSGEDTAATRDSGGKRPRVTGDRPRRSSSRSDPRRLGPRQLRARDAAAWTEIESSMAEPQKKPKVPQADLPVARRRKTNSERIPRGTAVRQDSPRRPRAKHREDVVPTGIKLERRTPPQTPSRTRIQLGEDRASPSSPERD